MDIDINLLLVYLQVCVASGKALRDAPWLRCKTCKHAMITAELSNRRACPLCHSPLQGLQEFAGGKSSSRAGPKPAAIMERD
jgi:hypothetical protein